MIIRYLDPKGIVYMHHDQQYNRVYGDVQRRKYQRECLLVVSLSV